MWGSAPPARGAPIVSAARGAGQFTFYVSCDVNLQVRVKVSELQGLLPAQRAQLLPVAGAGPHTPSLLPPHGAPLGHDATWPPPLATAPATAAGVGGADAYGSGTTSTSTSSLYVTARLVSCGDTMGLEANTAYAQPAEPPSTSGAAAGGGGWAATARWDEWLTFCIKYRDLQPDAQLALWLWEAAEGQPEALLGGTCLRLFNKRGRLKTGPQRLRVWEGRPPCTASPSSTPGKVPLAHRERLGVLEHQLQRHQRGEMPAGGEWLDALTLGEYRRLAALDREAWRLRPELRLTVLLPLFPQPVLYHQHVVPHGAAAAAGGGGSAGMAAAGKKEAAGGWVGSLASPDPSVSGGAGPGGATAIIRLLDPEVGRDNPAELKAQKLARGLQRGVLDRDLKPNSEERRRLQAILKLPPNKPLSAAEKELLWRFRASLTADTRALTKFLKCIDWGDALEAKQAAELMRQWAPISAADALELLSPDFRAEVVREHAVQALQLHDPEDLSLYLLQLVQALRYEAADSSRLAGFLVARAADDPALAVQLHWYLFCELDDPGFGLRARALHAELMEALAAGGPQGLLVADTIRRQVDLTKQLKAVIRELKSSKIKAARATERLREMVAESGPCGELTVMRVPLPLDSHIVLAGIVPKECSVFKSAMLPLKLSFRIEAAPFNWRAPSLEAAYGAPPPPRGSVGGPGAAPAPGWQQQQQQQPPGGAAHPPFAPPHPQHPQYPPGTGGSSGHSTAASGGSSGHHHPHPHHHPHHPGPPADPLALLPSRTGIVPAPAPAAAAAAGTPAAAAAAALAAAAAAHHHHPSYGPPYGGGHMVLESHRCWMIYKKGDDLRQDHFVLQMIGLMDRMLKRENLDLRMTPYKVLPTSCDDGLVEFVPSVPLSAVLAEHRTIHRFLALTQADPGGPFGLRAEVVETFVRSCAGYCVMTYILGVGDRHLDNLMLTHDGRLFHIDFGYILGNDPKPFPPPMKLCKEMIEAMGGHGSEYYKQFRMYACEAYNILRKRADLMLSLFHLMAGASIEAIRADPEKAILKLQDKFRLDFDDEAAVEWMQGLINESATALLPQIVETTHRWAQYWR